MRVHIQDFFRKILNGLYHILHNYLSSTSALFFVIILAAVLVLGNQSVQYRLGKVFFGKVPKLYNVTFANFFFTQAAYPFVGKAAPSAHYQLARTYFITGDLDKALMEANKELELYPINTLTYYLLGLIYGYMNEEDKAIASFDTYIKSHPTTWAGRNDKAWLEFRTGNIDAGITTLIPVASSTSNPWVQNTYGTLLMNKGKYNEARSAFTYAKNAAQGMSPKDWGYAYPGNDPRVYGIGLSAMIKSIDANLALLEEKIKRGE